MWHPEPFLSASSSSPMDLTMNAASRTVLVCIKLFSNGPIGIDDGLEHASMDISMNFLPRVYHIHINISTLQIREGNVYTNWELLIESRVNNNVVNNLRTQ